MASSLEPSPSRMEAAEIEMLVDDDDNSCRSIDGRPLFVRRRRLFLVTLILIAIAISIAVAMATINGRNEEEEIPKPSTQAGSQGDDKNDVFPDVANTLPPTLSPSRSPTAFPTRAPTPSPTKSPTASPTASSVAQPTGAPPTESPTSQPTASPTTASSVAQPTGAQPTGSPPTETLTSPTSQPTSSPTAASSVAQPTGAPPSEPPTASPAVSPTDDYSAWYNANVTLSSGPMFVVIDQIPHDGNAFTQGLTFADGRLFESTGLNGHSTVRELDPSTGDVLVSVPLHNQFFGEGLVYVNGKLIQITWHKATAFVWNANDLTIPPELFTYKTTKHNEGWGITHDPIKNELIVSDGSANLVFWNVDTLETNRTISVVRQDGGPAKNMNELEFWRGRVLANVWFQDVLLVIHPETGVVEKEYDFSTLWPKHERPGSADVFNGISISGDPEILYVTGKKWNRMYRVKLLP